MGFLWSRGLFEDICAFLCFRSHFFLIALFKITVDFDGCEVSLFSWAHFSNFRRAIFIDRSGALFKDFSLSSTSFHQNQDLDRYFLLFPFFSIRGILDHSFYFSPRALYHKSSKNQKKNRPPTFKLSIKTKITFTQRLRPHNPTYTHLHSKHPLTLTPTYTPLYSFTNSVTKII